MLLFILLPASVLWSCKHFCCHEGVVVWERRPQECPCGDSGAVCTRAALAGVQKAAAPFRQSCAGLKWCLNLVFTKDQRTWSKWSWCAFRLLQSHFQQRTACLSLLSCFGSQLFWGFCFLVTELCLRKLCFLLYWVQLLTPCLGLMFLSCFLYLHKGCLCFPQLLLFASPLQSRISGFLWFCCN